MTEKNLQYMYAFSSSSQSEKKITSLISPMHNWDSNSQASLFCGMCQEDLCHTIPVWSLIRIMYICCETTIAIAIVLNQNLIVVMESN